MYTHQFVYPFTTWGTSRLFPNSGHKDGKYKRKNFVFNSVTHLHLTIWTPWTAAHQASLSITNSQSLLKLKSIDLMIPSSHLTLSCSLLLLPSIFASIRVFSNESILHIRWPKYWSFSFASVLPMNIRDWFPLGWTDWISLQSKGLSRVFSNTTVQKH